MPHRTTPATDVECGEVAAHCAVCQTPLMIRVEVGLAKTWRPETRGTRVLCEDCKTDLAAEIRGSRPVPESPKAHNTPRHRNKALAALIKEVLCGVVLCSLLWGVTSQAGTLTLRWEAVTTNANGTPITDLAGYRVYYGRRTGEYQQARDVGADVTRFTLTDLAPDVEWFIAVTAFDEKGQESEYSNEVSAFPKTEAIGTCAEQPGAYVKTDYRVVPTRAKVPLYQGSTQYRLATVPPVLRGSCLVQTRLKDRDSRAESLVVLALEQDVTVYVGYDRRSGHPQWLLDHYEATGIRLQLNVGAPRMMLWAIAVQAGQTLTIPGNRYLRPEGGTVLPYTVWIQGES